MQSPDANLPADFMNLRPDVIESGFLHQEISQLWLQGLETNKNIMSQDTLLLETRSMKSINVFKTYYKEMNCLQ